MALPKIEFQINNGALGLAIPTDDGLCGLLLQGPAPVGLALSTPTLITSLEDAVALGITEAYDTANSVNVYRPIREFYAEGQNGLRLWIMIVSQTILANVLMDKAEVNYAVKLLNAAQGKIRMLGLVRSPDVGYTPNTTANNFDIDIVNGMVKAQALALEFQAQYKPVQIVMEAYAYAGNAGTLLDLKTLTHSRVSLVLGDTKTGKNATIGTFLGRCAKIPVQRNVGRVKDGALAITDAFLGVAAFASLESTVETIHDKGYIVLRRHIGKGGYYFSYDATATSATDDYNQWARVRVINKAIYLAYTTFVEQILDEIKVDDQGRIETAKAKYFQGLIDNQINANMTANDEISSFRSFVDPEQDIITTSKLCVQLRIKPVGYAKTIKIDLGFEK